MLRNLVVGCLLGLLLASCTAADVAGTGGQPAAGEQADGTQLPSGGDASTTSSTTTLPQIQLIGRVLDTSGAPISGATVSVSGASAITGPDGFYALEAGAAGMVTAVKPGWVSTERAWDGGPHLVEIELEPITVRALRVSANAAGDEAHFQELLDMADATAVNALVFDTKTEGGTVLYDTRVQTAHDIGAVAVTYDPVELIGKAREHGLYTITRIVSFDDAIKADAFPAQAIAGRWIDPRSRESWQYNIDLAIEACELGFDEIQLDYIRFPSGQAVAESGQLDLSQEERVDAVTAYLNEMRRALHPLGCSVSGDIFAIVVSSPTDQGIGQRPEELSMQLDALSPMIYPSHYSEGWLGFADPNEHPYDVTHDAIGDSLRRVEPGTLVRPWLQSFWWTSAQIRRSIQAAEDLGVGWMLWNIVSDYSIQSLPTDDEVSGS